MFGQVRAAQHLLSEKGSILDIPREMSACMADGKYMELVKLYRKAHTTYSSSILSQVPYVTRVTGAYGIECVRSGKLRSTVGASYSSQKMLTTLVPGLV